MKLYGVYNPKGKLVFVEETLFDAKILVFACMTQEFQSRYWKQVGPAWTAARKLGWKIVKGQFKPT